MTALGSFQLGLAIQIFVFMAVGIWLTFLVSSNLTKPLQEITHVLRKVQHGLFETRVRVTSNDEIGYTGDVINAMTEGLIERDRIKQSLSLAKEIQQNLLPKDTLKLDGFDIAGKSEYCDETGGDYFDFIPAVGGEDQKLGVVIGDVSGHGISSALLMATVRSALRQRAFHPGSAAQIISDVNRQLVQDIEPSCEFVTLFFLIIDTASKELTWVRAGHDPAILYDPASDSFEELGGSGMPLGVDGQIHLRGAKGGHAFAGASHPARNRWGLGGTRLEIDTEMPRPFRSESPEIFIVVQSSAIQSYFTQKTAPPPELRPSAPTAMREPSLLMETLSPKRSPGLPSLRVTLRRSVTAGQPPLSEAVAQKM